ncbi:DUF5325 family protein [Paenibacillus sp. YN15]|uniref:DUF5325 family protein n=1 Tax=Paenibacillus sp. YN15 TaxID=1742774 RepID=UPI000DCE517A|nr:DUF5325 family protein [Paenibacillus sp. YN15]RAV06313.1 hypothetical protein DQG13_00210 [Paenibacillus sp. YN15]
MPRWMALLFACIGILLLAGVSFFISLRSLWGVVLCGAAALLWIGFGFGMKARARRRQAG